MKNIAAKIIKYAFTLFIVTALASGSLAYTYSITKDRIEAMKLKAQIEAVKEVCSGIEDAEIKKDDKKAEGAKEKVEILDSVFVAEKDGEAIAYAFLVHPRGYGGPMSVIVGTDAEGNVTGVKVIEAKETPGLGDKVIASNDFLVQFKGKTPEDPVEIKEDIDAVSGATISSKGVTQGVRAALDAYEAIFSGDDR